MFQPIFSQYFFLAGNNLKNKFNLWFVVSQFAGLPMPLVGGAGVVASEGRVRGILIVFALLDGTRHLGQNKACLAAPPFLFLG